MVQKYIVGDIVEYDNKVMVIKEPRDGNHFDLSCPKEGLVYCLIDIDEIKPVRITPEILEKNGWVRVDDEPVDSEIEYFGTEFSNGVNLFYNILSGTYRYGKHTIMIYLHELQHLFWGLQLKHEMEV